MGTFSFKKHTTYTLLLIIIFQIIINGCNSERNEIEQNLGKIIGSQLTIPVKLIPQNFEMSEFSKDYVKSKLKIIVYVDSSSCTECRIRGLLHWQNFVDSLQNETLKMLFIFNSQDLIYIKKTLAIYDFKFPYFVDFENEFKKNNFLPENPFYHTFLVHENHVLIAGNPLFNTKLTDLYLKQIDKFSND
jgi:hypothetical protein